MPVNYIDVLREHVIVCRRRAATNGRYAEIIEDYPGYLVDPDSTAISTQKLAQIYRETADALEKAVGLMGQKSKKGVL